jgi:hypothetical protein
VPLDEDDGEAWILMLSLHDRSRPKPSRGAGQATVLYLRVTRYAEVGFCKACGGVREELDSRAIGVHSLARLSGMSDIAAKCRLPCRASLTHVYSSIDRRHSSPETASRSLAGVWSAVGAPLP